MTNDTIAADMDREIAAKNVLAGQLSKLADALNDLGEALTVAGRAERTHGAESDIDAGPDGLKVSA